MNQDQVLGVVRAILAAVGGYFVAKGSISADQVTLIGGAAAAVITAVWSFLNHAAPKAA